MTDPNAPDSASPDPAWQQPASERATECGGADSDRSRYRLGVLGLGNRSRTLIRAAQRSLRFDVVAVSDGWPGQSGPIGPAMTEAADAEYVTDWQRLLALDLDAVVVAVPNDRHYPMAAAALDRGLHVLCEKPIATSAEHARDLLARAERARGHLHIGMELRYAPMTQMLLADLASGVLRAPKVVWAQEFRPPFLPGARRWRLDAQRSGGTLLEKNCHHFDLFCLLLGDRPVGVTAQGTGSAVGMLDHAVIGVEFAGGAIGACTVTMTQGSGHLRLGLLGDGWAYEYDSRRQVSRIERAEVVTEQHWRLNTDGLDGGGWNHPGEVEQFRAFAARIDGNADALTERVSPLWGHLIAFAGEQAVRESRLVRITEGLELE